MSMGSPLKPGEQMVRVLKRRVEYDYEEEEEGRFYGDGLDDRQREILEYIDSRDREQRYGPGEIRQGVFEQVAHQV